MRALLALVLLTACGGDSGVSNDPGRSVAGCFDCAPSEYCLIVSGATDVPHCAAADCGTGCDCIIDDGQSRLESCREMYSCQAGSGILYCFE